MRTTTNFKRLGLVATINVAMLAGFATTAHAQDNTALPPVDPAVLSLALRDTADAAQGVTNLRLRAALSVARAQVGKPYVYATRGPDTFDCSGLMQYAYAKAGIRIAGSTGDQISSGTAVTDIADIQPGDLVFIPGAEGTMANPGHVGMYLGAGMVIQSPHTGDVVRITPLSNWSGEIAAIRRIVPYQPPAAVANLPVSVPSTDGTVSDTTAKPAANLSDIGGVDFQLSPHFTGN